MHYVAMNMPAGIGFRYRLYDREPFMLPREGALANAGSTVKDDIQAVANKKETPQADKIE